MDSGSHLFLINIRINQSVRDLLFSPKRTLQDQIVYHLEIEATIKLINTLSTVKGNFLYFIDICRTARLRVCEHEPYITEMCLQSC